MTVQGADYDVLVVGSGFGGSVTALRLTEKGYRVGVLEAGRRFEDHEFAATSWRAKDYVFAPALGLLGIQRMDLLRNVLVVSGAGVGGGSLVYGNTLYRPPQTFFDDPHWAGHHRLGRGAGRLLRPGGADAGRLDVPPHGVRPGAPIPDPYFGGAGPTRAGCLHCGECMTGCRHNAKNTTVKNYLHLAGAAGATVRTGSPRRRRTTFVAEQVVFAAAALGTQKLLHRLRDGNSLPDLSPRLGELSRTNSEAVVGIRARGDAVDYSQGVAITSSIHLADGTHVEPCRYGHGSNTMGLMMAVLTDPVAGRARLPLALREMWARRRDLVRLHDPRHWSEQTVALLAMQSLDNSLTTFTRRRLLGGRKLTTRQGIGEPNPTWNPRAHEVARLAAAHMDGIPGAGWADMFDIPTTGHFLGGCPIGVDRGSGVVDPYHRVHGYPGLHVIDGSTVAANLGVNPSLTITAMAERAVSLWPNKGETDPRPGPGQAYRRLAPVAPTRPAVPASAPAALRLSVDA